MQSGPLYEATFFVAPGIVGEFDQWLAGHIRSRRAQPGIIDCNALSATADQDGRARRTCLYEFADDDALDAFLHDDTNAVNDELAAAFDVQIEMRGRVYREESGPGPVAGLPGNCLNCGSRLTGQYCGSCGQRSRNRLISLWELITDAFGDLFEIDSRLWQTLLPLVRRPGLLTHDYLQGRRARYMPPFRMYLVLSLLFFVVAFFDPREELGLLFGPPPAPTAEETAAELDSDCDIDAADLEDLPNWLAQRLTMERLQRICERTQIDDGQALLDKLLENIPAALIVLLPLMALVLKAVYPLSKRYYVEHLLFFVHFHAFFFLILTLQILFVRLAAMLHVPELASILTVFATSIYIPVYLFISMRRVYSQSRLITALKYIVLVIAYLTGFFTTMLSALAIAAFSI